MEHCPFGMESTELETHKKQSRAFAVRGGTEMGLEEIEQFFRTFDPAVYRVMAGGRNAVTEERLAEFEQALDFRFPEPFRQFTLSPLGGLYIEVREELWPRPQAGDEPGWRDQFGLKVFGLCAPIPEWLDLREEVLRLPEQEADLIPIMALVGCESRFCYDLDGALLQWSPDGARSLVGLDFAELVMRELGALEARRGMLVGKKRRGRPRKSS